VHAALGDDASHPGPYVVAVAQQRGERGDHEHRRERVEHPYPRLDEGHPVADEQDAGDAAEQRGAGEPARGTDDQQHGQGAGQRCRDAPAEPVVSEDHLADGDELLAQRRMDDEFVARVVLHAAVAQHLPRLQRVVLLVEDGGAAVGRVAEAREPGRGGDQRQDERDDPAA
jgi:hypothetical protein